MAYKGPFLIIEDNPHCARGLARLIGELWPAIIASSVREAREVLARVEQPAGLVIDVGLGDGSGINLLAEIRKRLPDVPSLVLTGLM